MAVPRSEGVEARPETAPGPGRGDGNDRSAAAVLDAESIIHQPSRLRIMAALVALPAGEAADFRNLKALLGLTDGNLSTHLSTLEEAGYVSVEKGFVGKRPRTWIWVTSKGRDAFGRYVTALESIIKAAAGPREMP